jgi:TM2 domain-containing membrane protein YozV
MEQSKIDMFIAMYSSKFPSEKLMLIRNQLEKLDDNKYIIIQSMSYKDPTVLLIVSILIGSLGIDRFMLGHVGLGVGKLLTCGGLGIWTIIDWFLIMGAAREENFNKFMQVAY